MQKFGFKIKTKTGTTVENLVIHAQDGAEAEQKLLRMYHHATVIEMKVLDELPRGEGTDLEGAISLIVGHTAKP
jgi:hypothetical protein